MSWPAAMAACFDIEARDLWRTPRAVFEHYNATYGFILDAAASELDALAPRWIGPDLDALQVSWVAAAGGAGQSAWCNPPYSRRAGGLGTWIAKGLEEASRGLDVVMLVPPNVDASYWSLVDQAVEDGRARVDLIRGRLAFRDPTTDRPVRGNRGGSAVVHLWPMRRLALSGYAEAPVRTGTRQVTGLANLGIRRPR